MSFAKRIFGVCFIFVIGVSAWGAGVGQLNILFILADDLGYGDLGSYGCDDIRTPHLDQLAKEGMRFTDFYSNGQVCSPTRMGFLTGRYQQRMGIDNALNYQEMGRGLAEGGRTLANDLKGAGYVTGLSGKWHVGYDVERQPLQQGFDHFFGLLGGNHHYFEHMDRIGVADLWAGNDEVEREGYTTDLITEDAVGFIRDNKDERFFLYLSHAAPHFPWQGPGDKDLVVVPKKPSWQIGSREIYKAMVERMDAGIGEVLGELDRLGLRENTIVVFSSDNGGHTYSRNLPLSGWKSELWEGGIRVPCIVRWPGVVEVGSVTEAVGITMDWTATFRRMAGVQMNGIAEDGIDLMGVLKGGKGEERTLFWRSQSGPRRKAKAPGRTVRRGDWKLREMGDGEHTLINLREDIGERKNRIEDYPELAKELSEAMDAWENEVGR